MDTRTPDPPAANAPVAAAPIYAARSYGAWNGLGLWTLLKREIMRFMKVWAQTLMAPLMSTLLFMMVFSFAFPGRTWSDMPYLYANGLAPGLVMLGVLTNAFQNTSSSLVGAKIQGTATDFLMPPLSALELTIAFLAGAVARGLAVGVASLLALAAFADVAPTHFFAALYFSVVGATIFAAVGLLGGLWANKFDHLAAVTTFLITPLTMLSGTFYSVDALPEALDVALHWNPVFFLIDGFRYAFLDHAHSDLLFGGLFTGALAVGLSVLCWHVLKRGYGLKA